MNVNAKIKIFNVSAQRRNRAGPVLRRGMVRLHRGVGALPKIKIFLDTACPHILFYTVVG